ncbi:MAG: acetyl-CoA carboxylase carboxyl transferase subunit alpha [candidate division Zixibacteria bacterium HGW-Zixibacteria-1]|nr:MAG: acetyl-CoA carboxylase carboxyl transferase subunit alpha [candidate division Zixibacteria bacterium HGW-Zixibacteria-1]
MEDRQILDFEKPIIELQKKISDMKDFASGANLELSGEIKSLESKLDKMRREIFSGLSRWQKVLLARHPRRPYTLDYIKNMTTDFIELHGDRYFADDKAIIGGFAKLDGKPVLIVGQQKGRDTKQKLYRNFGMPHPEGYRKALRLFKLAEKFNKPIVILVDTPGAFPGIGAEERGQAEAIARNLREMSILKVPIVIVIIGEGASGGALGIAIGDRVFMLQYSWYSVISPEGCAAILWRDNAYAPQAAEALKLTADDLMDLKIIDKIIEEPPGGAHNDPELMAQNVKKEVLAALAELEQLTEDDLLVQRLQKFRKLGVYQE